MLCRKRDETGGARRRTSRSSAARQQKARPEGAESVRNAFGGALVIGREAHAHVAIVEDRLPNPFRYFGRDVCFAPGASVRARARSGRSLGSGKRAANSACGRRH